MSKNEISTETTSEAPTSEAPTSEAPTSVVTTAPAPTLPALLPYQAKRLAASVLRAEQENAKRKLDAVNARLDARNLKGEQRTAARVDIANEESDGLPATLNVPCRKVVKVSKNGRKSVRYVPVGTMDVGKASYWAKGAVSLAKASGFTVEGIARTIEAARSLDASMTD